MMTAPELPTITTASVTLRPPVPGELAELARSLSEDPEASPWLGTDPETTMRWFTGQGVCALIVECDGSAGGVITFEEELDPDYRSANIDIGLLARCADRGVGTAALRALITWLIHERGHHRITIDPDVDNGRAIRAYEKVGFRPVGVMREYERGSDGTYHDNLLMDLLAREFEPRV